MGNISWNFCLVNNEILINSLRRAILIPKYCMNLKSFWVLSLPWEVKTTGVWVWTQWSLCWGKNSSIEWHEYASQFFFNVFYIYIILQNRRNSDRSLEMETWHDLANLYTSLSKWRDAEACLSKSKIISPYSASRWHSTGD